MTNDLNFKVASEAISLSGPVAVLLGGKSAEREVSLKSGEAIFSALKSRNIAAEKVDTKSEDWLDLLANNYAHVFIALHGGDGEDGTVQGALENIGVSYTGSGVSASSLAMDKVHCKYLWQGMDLPTPEFVELNEKTDWQEIIQRWGKAIVKPSTEGSSIGMAIATTADQLQDAYEMASQYDSNVMAEQWMHGAEYTVSILGERALPVIRLETDHSFYDYDAKYIADDTRYICPCGLSAEKEKELQQLALLAFKSVGCSGWGRVDVMTNEEGGFYLLEVNTVPGMTSHSLVPMAAKSAGISFDDLVVQILKLSL